MNAFVIDHDRQCPADSRYVGKFPESQKTKHHEVVTIVVHVPQAADNPASDARSV